MLTDGEWHPEKDDTFLTSSVDGSLRLWNLEGPRSGMEQQLSQDHVLKVLDKRGSFVGGYQGVFPNCCKFDPVTRGAKIVAGCNDGSLQLFFSEKPDRRPGTHFGGSHATLPGLFHRFHRRNTCYSLSRCAFRAEVCGSLQVGCLLDEKKKILPRISHDSAVWIQSE